MKVVVEVDAKPVRDVATLLDVSERNLRLWRSELRKVLRRSEFDWADREPSISAKSIQILATYKALIEKLGKQKARQHLKVYGV